MMYDEMFLRHAGEPREPDWDEEAYGDPDEEPPVCDRCGRVIGMAEGEAHPDGVDYDVSGAAICEDCRAEMEACV